MVVEKREHTLSKDCWCNPRVESYPAHVHNSYTCSPHVEGCDCTSKETTTCNPYWKPGACPDVGDESNEAEILRTEFYRESALRHRAQHDLNESRTALLLARQRLERIEARVATWNPQIREDLDLRGVLLQDILSVFSALSTPAPETPGA